MNRRLTISLLAGALVGCSPSWYRQSADLQVNDLLRDRTQSTLGYKPEVAVNSATPPPVPKKAYEKIPTSPPPPPTGSAIARQETAQPSGPLGPDTRLMRNGISDETRAATTQPSGRVDQSRVLGPPAPFQQYPHMDLFGVLGYAVQHSRSYQDQMEQMYLAALDVTLQRHLLSPRPFVTQGFTYTSGQKDIAYQTALTAATSAGVRQRLPYGGEIVAQSLVQFVDAISDNATGGESASLALAGSLPLLRGAGMINLEGLISSERNLVYQVRAFENFRRSFAVDIAAAYFRIIQQQQGLVNRRLNLINNTNLTERAQALYDAGRLQYLEVQRAVQSQISAESSMVAAEQAYQSSLEDFKLLIGMPIDEPMDLAGVQVDVPIPVDDPDAAVSVALRYRLDLQTASDHIDDARRGVSNAANGLLPGLDLTGQAQVTNSPDRPATAINSDTATYSAGVSIDLPVDRVAERNAYRRSLISLDQTQRAYAFLKDQIINNVRSDLRGIRSAQLTVQIQQRGMELAEKRLELSNELLRQGRIQTRDIVEAQSSLLDAQDAYEQAHSDLQIRILQYMRDTGTLRVDPRAGAIGRAMDRTGPPVIR